VASALAQRGVNQGSRVVWQSDRSHDAVIVALGILRRGAVLVPVSAEQSAWERTNLIDDVSPELVVGPLRLTDTECSVPQCEPSGLLRAKADEEDLTSSLALSDDAVIIYTSGTTGQPKGAVLTHGNLASGISALQDAWEVSPDDCLVSALPLFHVHGLVVALFGVLSAGGAVDLQDKFDPGRFLAGVKEKGASLAYCVPTMLYRLADEGDLSVMRSLRLLVSGSAPLPVALFETFAREAGQKILERYGMTETMLTFSNPLKGERRPGTVGMALPGVQALLPEPGAPDAELKVQGPSVFSGYWKRPDATAAVFSDGWFSTGDLVRVDADGYVSICGRSKELIISGGYNVYPSEIEDVLRGHFGIVDVAVVGRPSAKWGEEVTAFVVTRDDIAPELIREALAGLLSPYKIPRSFVRVDELPRNAMGKLQRHLLS